MPREVKHPVYTSVRLTAEQNQRLEKMRGYSESRSDVIRRAIDAHYERGYATPRSRNDRGTS